MAKQVRPWSAKPALAGALKVRPTDRGANQQNPSGTASVARAVVRMYRCNLCLSAGKTQSLGKVGASMYDQGPGSDARAVACAAECTRRVTAECAQRRPTQNRELAPRPVKAKSAQGLSATARLAVRAGL